MLGGRQLPQQASVRVSESQIVQHGVGVNITEHRGAHDLQHPIRRVSRSRMILARIEEEGLVRLGFAAESFTKGQVTNLSYGDQSRGDLTVRFDAVVFIYSDHLRDPSISCSERNARLNHCSEQFSDHKERPEAD